MSTPHSLSERVTLTCTGCAKSFSAEVWLIVDRAERPDLVVRIPGGTIRAVRCPHCGAQGWVDAPLLVYWPEAPLPGLHLLLVTTRSATVAQSREHARELAGLLRTRLGGSVAGRVGGR